MSVELDDEVALTDVDLWRLLGILGTEELRQALHLKLVDIRKAKPLAATGKYESPACVVNYEVLFSGTLIFGFEVFLLAHFLVI